MKQNRYQSLKPQLQEVWRLSLPAILTQITTIAMQYIDSAMVGRLGANASAAIGLVASSTWLMNGVCYALAAGFSVQVAHRIGAGNEKEARNVVRHGLLSAVLVAGLLCLIGVAIHMHLPVWLKGDAEITYDAGRYFLTFAWMLPFTQMSSLTSSFLQCAGDMLTPSILNAVMCVLDVIFNTLLIPKHGVFGAGLGTMLACAVVSLLMLYFCCARNGQLCLRREEQRFDASILRAALRIGTPVAVQEVAMCGAQVVSTAIIAPLGAVSVAANAFAVTAESICYMPGYGIANAAAALVGRSVGAGDMEKAKRCGNICIGLGAFLMTCTGAVMMLNRCGRRAARRGRYVCAEPFKSRQYLACPSGKRAAARAALRPHRHVDRHGCRALYPGTAPSLPPENKQILLSKSCKKAVIFDHGLDCPCAKFSVNA